jgi:hypothetical protein
MVTVPAEIVADYAVEMVASSEEKIGMFTMLIPARPFRSV